MGFVSRAFQGIFGGGQPDTPAPTAPPPPPPPPEAPPQPKSPKTQMAGEKAGIRAMGAAGFGSTIATSPLGIPQGTSTNMKKLLGE